jgi:transcriptional regulator with XRE-family HTH domain
MNIGEKIKQRRKELGLSVDEVALKLGKNRATVYRYENSDIDNLPITILPPLARILKTTPSFFFDNNDDGEKEYIDKIVILTEICGDQNIAYELLCALEDLDSNGIKESIKFMRALALIDEYKSELRIFQENKEEFLKGEKTDKK